MCQNLSQLFCLNKFAKHATLTNYRVRSTFRYFCASFFSVPLLHSYARNNFHEIYSYVIRMLRSRNRRFCLTHCAVPVSKRSGGLRVLGRARTAARLIEGPRPLSPVRAEGGSRCTLLKRNRDVCPRTQRKRLP